ncbi:MAG: hypothetical protein ACO2YY_05630 [Pseudohongiellaceae bacterium]|jgi:hypothetical protein
MIFIIYFFALLLLLAGIVILVNPDIVINLIQKNTESPGLYAGAILARLGLGIILVMMAGFSRFPLAVTVIGWLAIAAAAVFLFLGKRRFQAMIKTILVKLKPWGRVGGIASLGFGGFLLYAFV